jgi:flagellar biosynthesis GTPase FlhF
MSKKVYTTGKVQQLVDLNEDLTNFKLRFNLTSKNGEEFDMAITDQYTIDNNNEDIVFKRVKNTISGTIVSDKNVFQNHFLILKSAGEKPADVEVVINKQEIPPNPESVAEQNDTRNDDDQNIRNFEQNKNVQNMQNVIKNHERSMPNFDKNVKNDTRDFTQNYERSERPQEKYNKDILQRQNQSENYEEEKTTWIDIRLIIIILIFILAAIFIYNLYSKNSGITTTLPTPNIVSPPPPPVVSPPPIVESSPIFSFSKPNLFNKLNSNIPKV